MTPGELEAMVEAIVERKLREAFAPFVGSSTSKPDDELVAAKDAYKSLGFPSEQALYNAVKQGLFRIGKEVYDRRAPGSKKPRYQFHIPNCQKRLETDPDRRKAV